VQQAAQDLDAAVVIRAVDRPALRSGAVEAEQVAHQVAGARDDERVRDRLAGGVIHHPHVHRRLRPAGQTQADGGRDRDHRDGKVDAGERMTKHHEGLLKVGSCCIIGT
jgi:hypothetical protein